MTRLTLVRHGETDWNRERRIQGETDIPLNDRGREQSRAAGALLASQIDEAHPVVVVSSDLSRARETAQIIATALGVAETAIFPSLRERRYGEAEGAFVDDFLTRWGPWHTAEVPGAETSEELRARARAALDEVATDPRWAGERPQVIAVSHGAFIRELIQHASDDTLPHPRERLLNGSAHRFVLEPDRLRLLSYTAVEPDMPTNTVRVVSARR